jgi:hypothetical protein
VCEGGCAGVIKGQKACGRRDGGTLTSVTQFEEKKVTLSLRVQAFAARPRSRAGSCAGQLSVAY